MKNKHLFRRFVSAFVFLMLCSHSWAYDFEAGGIYYSINESEVSVAKGGKYSGDVVIPSTVVSDGTTYNVTGIDEQAFYNCSDLTSVIIPESVTSIGNYAFYGCSALTSATIGNGVKTIGKRAFYNCRSLTSIKIPDSVTDIDLSAFMNCYALTSVSIGRYLF